MLMQIGRCRANQTTPAFGHNLVGVHLPDATQKLCMELSILYLCGNPLEGAQALRNQLDTIRSNSDPNWRRGKDGYTDSEDLQVYCSIFNLKVLLQTRGATYPIGSGSKEVNMGHSYNHWYPIVDKQQA